MSEYDDLVERRLMLARELKRKRDAGQELPGTEWLRKWTDETLSAPPHYAPPKDK
jgi:hypothetical protein